MKIAELFKLSGLFVATALLATACGGGGGTATAPPATAASTTLTGTAAAGAPIIGTVTIKDSTTPTALTRTVSIEADGKYTVDVSGLKAPYMVRADGNVSGNEIHLYSACTSGDIGGTINITPLTDLIVANIAGSLAKTYFDNGSFSGLTPAQLATQSDALKSKLLPILAAIGVSDSIDLLRASFSADHTGLDAVLDTVKVTTDTTTNVATITNIINQEKITSNLSGTYAGTLTNAGVTSGVGDLQAISAVFKQFSALFATKLPSDTNPDLLALFDQATFLQEGGDLESLLSQITTGADMIGVAFANVSIRSIDTKNGTAVVDFTVIQNGVVQQDAPKSWFMIKGSDGKWLMQGDQRIAYVAISSSARYDTKSSLIQTGLKIDIEDKNGRGITSAVVTGKGLSAPVTLLNQINHDQFVMQGNDTIVYYFMDDTQIGSIADTGEIYTVKLYAGTTLKATYAEKLLKRPNKNSELTPASFPSFAAATASRFSSFQGGDLPTSWTMPSGLTNSGLDCTLWDGTGNSANIEYSLAPADRSKTVTLQAQTSTGQTFTPANRWLSLTGADNFGRKLEVVTH
jgi:hypothetical protein